MRHIVRMTVTAALVGLLAAAAGAQSASNPPAVPTGVSAPRKVPQEASFRIRDSFTAQRRPRVTVLNFEDTNQDAQEAKYGDAVEAMLVTFFKRKSQFVVVERQKIDTLLSEKERLQMGMVDVAVDDQAGQALLEKIDVFVLGSVTILDTPPLPQAPDSRTEEPDYSQSVEQTSIKDAQLIESSAKEKQGEMTIQVSVKDEPAEAKEPSRAERLAAIGGPRIEIDAKLISRFDGRIIAAAQRSGPLACLRSIVERLGIALEQEFLRPYYGKLTVTLPEPERIRIFLTPILPEDALDEEKPPVERSTTVTIGGDHDEVESWMTDPSTYTIESLLSGWYSMRIERFGYTGIGVGNARWEVRKRLGKEVVYDRIGNLPLNKTDPEISRFVVRVDPLTTEVVSGTERGFSLAKKGGSFTPVARRQYLDTDYGRPPGRVILLGGSGIELNKVPATGEYADDPKCDLFEETDLPPADSGRTYITTGQSFDFNQFTGGELIIEDYRGERVPVGRYDMVVWEPAYDLFTTPVSVRENDDKKPVKVSLLRETAPLEVEATGPRPANRTILEGRTTGHRVELPLDFQKIKEIPGVPVDSYLARTNIEGLAHWGRGFEIPIRRAIPPVYDTSSEKYKPRLIQASRNASDAVLPAVNTLGIKTRFVLAGRLDVLSRRPDPLASETFVDREVEKILQRLLYPQEESNERAQDLTQEETKGQTQPQEKQAPKIAPTAEAVTQQDLARAVILYQLLAAQNKEAPAPWANAPAYPDTQSQPTTAASDSTGDKKSPPPDPLPKDPEALQGILASRLEVVDLLILNPDDMVQLRQSPEVAGIIARWVDAGGTLFAFVSAPGDYRDAVGAPLMIDRLGKKTKRFDLAPGNLPGIVQVTKKKIKSKGRRQLPELTDLDRTWRVLAYSKEGKGPRIIERASIGAKGTVLLWFDDPEAFRGRWGGTRPEVEQTRANVEEHVFKLARSLMHTRFGGSSTESAGQPTTSRP